VTGVLCNELGFGGVIMTTPSRWREQGRSGPPSGYSGAAAEKGARQPEGEAHRRSREKRARARPAGTLPRGSLRARPQGGKCILLFSKPMSRSPRSSRLAPARGREGFWRGELASCLHSQAQGSMG